MKYLSDSPEETFRLGEDLGRKLKGTEVLLLRGDLGLGKTLFTKGLARAMEIEPREVVSPSFTLVNHFYGRFPLVHIDLYRLGNESVRLNHLPEIDDALDESVIVVEWAQYLDESYYRMPQAVEVRFRLLPGEQREIVVKTRLDYLTAVESKTGT